MRVRIKFVSFVYVNLRDNVDCVCIGDDCSGSNRNTIINSTEDNENCIIMKENTTRFV